MRNASAGTKSTVVSTVSDWTAPTRAPTCFLSKPYVAKEKASASAIQGGRP